MSKRIKKIAPQILWVFLLVLSLSAIDSPAQIYVDAVESVGFTVSDMDDALDFFSNVLSFKKVSEIEVHGPAFDQLTGVFGVRMHIVKLQLGTEFLELTEYLTPRGRNLPVDSRSNDHWFQHIAIVVSDMDSAYQILRQHNVQHVSTAPQRLPEWNPVAGGIEAFYFQDNDGHNLELIYFPEGKGDPRWQSEKGSLFLGIDHTAIAVAGTEESLEFYQQLLGFRFAGRSENYGQEQEYLNHVFGAHLLITGLRAALGPGIEFLEYLTPANGRPTPKHIQSNDLMHWQTTLRVSDIHDTHQLLLSHNTWMVSNHIVKFEKEQLEFKSAFIARDIDGHALRFVQY